MGNCQAADAATVVIQHPGGRIEKLYWPVSAVEIMRSNPGHYVALITLSPPEETRDNNGVRFTRVKLLRPKDTLLLGQVYRLVTSQEVMKGLRAKKYGKMKKPPESLEEQKRNREHTSQQATESRQIQMETNQVTQQDINGSQDRHGSKAAQSAARSRHWRPSLQSISEIGS